MKHIFNLILYFFILSCSNSKNDGDSEKAIDLKDNKKHEWPTFIIDGYSYVDTSKRTYKLKFKYPPSLVVEQCKMGLCIGKKIKTKAPDDPITNTMDCCIRSSDLRLMSALVYLEGKNPDLHPFHESISSVKIADRDADRVQLIENKTNKILKDYVFLDLLEYEITYEIVNTKLSPIDFDYFLKTIEITQN
ncbi:hypothetical protein [Adhaeribacter terreus]|uniref:DUF4377 domain-containing protein n=1 Tax=Adhaeribacter terreus TaxID=529703 RepID=A0ABW0EB88_9BACT